MLETYLTVSSAPTTSSWLCGLCAPFRTELGCVQRQEDGTHTALEASAVNGELKSSRVTLGDTGVVVAS